MVLPASPVRCLTIPGLNNSGPSHWQSRWESLREDFSRVELGSWHDPQRNEWVAELDRAIASDDRPAVLVAHSLGCLTVAWWLTQASERQLALVRGALLVAPPDVDRSNASAILQRFGPAPNETLPVPAVLIASGNDPCAGIAYSKRVAATWGVEFIDVGHLGHINAASGLGDWDDGQVQLERLINCIATPQGFSGSYPLGPRATQNGAEADMGRACVRRSALAR